MIDPASGNPEDNDVLETTRDDHLGDLLMAAGFGASVRYDHLRSRWLYWEAPRWRVDRKRHVYDLMRTMGNDILADLSGKNKEVAYKAALHIFDWNKKETILKSLSARAEIAMAGTEWDQDPYLLGFENGIMDLRTGVFDTHPSPDTLVSKSVGCDWDSESQCPKFAQFIQDIMGRDPELFEYLLTLLGYACFGLQSEQKFWMWTGRGSNGKGILARTMNRVLGEYSDTPSSELYMRTRVGAALSSAARPDLVRLQGKRFTYMSEPQGGQFNEELLKAHTGEDIILARDLYGRSDSMAQFPPTHKIIFLTNEPPKTDDVGVSMRRRARMVRFEQDYTGDRADMTLEGKIEQEKPGILVLLVAYAQTWWNGGLPALNEPEKVQAWSEEYISVNDPLAKWLEDDCILDRDEKTGSAVLYGDYEDWCARRGFDVKSQMAFSSLLVKRFPKARSSSGVQFAGLKLKPIEKRVGGDDED